MLCSAHTVLFRPKVLDCNSFRLTKSCRLHALFFKFFHWHITSGPAAFSATMSQVCLLQIFFWPSYFVLPVFPSQTTRRWRAFHLSTTWGGFLWGISKPRVGVILQSKCVHYNAVCPQLVWPQKPKLTEQLLKDQCTTNGQNYKGTQGNVESSCGKNGRRKNSKFGYELLARRETKYWQTQDGVVQPGQPIRPKPGRFEEEEATSKPQTKIKPRKQKLNSDHEKSSSF